MAPNAAGDTVRIDCGSSQAYRTADGRLFQADQYFTSGSPYTNPAIVDVLGTTDDMLYRTERNAPSWQAPMRYQIPVPTGDYLVRLHLAELYFGATGGPSGAFGQRVFNVRLEGRRVLINYDSHSTGGMTAAVREYRTTVTDGNATLEFVPIVGEPAITAIEVLRQPTGSTPTGCHWTPRAAVALERKEGQCAVAGGQLYTFGGYYSGLNATNLTQRYNLTTDQWTTLAPMPLALTHMAAVGADTTVWVVGGFIGNYPGVVTDAVLVYDTQANTWRAGPPLPQRRGAGAAVLLGRQLHYFGGLEPDIQTDSPLHYVLNLDDEATGWQLAAPLPMPRCHLGAAVRGGKIYALAGQQGHNVSSTNTAFVHEYDPLTDSWTRRADFPTERSHFETAVNTLDGRILTAGGYGGYSNYEDIQAYDPDANQWTQWCDLPLPLGTASAKLIGNTLVVAQGESESQLGPETATYSTILSSAPSNLLRFSQPQLALQIAAGTSAILPNYLWTLSGTATYTLTPTALPTWLMLVRGTSSGTTDPQGQHINFRADATSLTPGTYTTSVQATAPGYAVATTTVTLTVTARLATSKEQELSASLFPNPAGDQATLQFYSATRQQAEVEIRNSLGQLLWQGKPSTAAGDNHITLAIHSFAPGIYLVQLRLREGVSTIRLSVTR